MTFREMSAENDIRHHAVQEIVEFRHNGNFYPLLFSLLVETQDIIKKNSSLSLEPYAFEVNDVLHSTMTGSKICSEQFGKEKRQTLESIENIARETTRKKRSFIITWERHFGLLKNSYWSRFPYKGSISMFLETGQWFDCHVVSFYSHLPVTLKRTFLRLSVQPARSPDWTSMSSF